MLQIYQAAVILKRIRHSLRVISKTSQNLNLMHKVKMMNLQSISRFNPLKIRLPKKILLSRKQYLSKHQRSILTYSSEDVLILAEIKVFSIVFIY